MSWVLGIRTCTGFPNSGVGFSDLRFFFQGWVIYGLLLKSTFRLLIHWGCGKLCCRLILECTGCRALSRDFRNRRAFGCWEFRAAGSFSGAGTVAYLSWNIG